MTESKVCFALAWVVPAISSLTTPFVLSQSRVRSAPSWRVRSRLRYHLQYELQSFLVRSDHTTEAVLEHHLSQDLDL